MNKHMVILLVIMAITFACYNACDSRYYRRNCIALVTAIMTCFTGLRSWWMGDLIKYYTLYRNCNGENWMETVFGDYGNIGIRLFFKAAGSLGFSYDICLFLIAALSAVTLGMLLYRYAPTPYWGYLMYIAMGIYVFTYSGLKQTIAMAILMLAAIGIFEDNPRKFLLWTLVATIFHMPAAIFIVAYPIAKKKMDRYYVLILIVAMVCVFVFRDQIVAWFSEAYYEDETKYYAKKTIGGRALMMALFIVAGLILRPAQREDKIYSQVVNLMVMAAVIQTFSVYDNVFTRLADYYYQFVALHMPLMLESSNHQLKMRAPYPVRRYSQRTYRVAWVFVTLFALWFYSNSISGNGPTIGDYKFFWEIDPYALYGQ